MSTTIDGEGPTLPQNVPADRVVDFDMYDPPGIEEGLQEAFVALRDGRSEGLVWTPHNGGHWIAIRAEMVREVASHPDVFSSVINFLPKAAGSHGFLPSTVDPPEHRPYRKIVSTLLGPKTVRRIGPGIQQTARDLIERLRPRGECDFVKDYAEEFPVHVFLDMVGLPRSDAGKLKWIAQRMTKPDGNFTLAQGRDAFTEYLAPVLAQRRADPGDDALSDVVAGEVDGRPINEDESLRIAGLLLLGGLDTVGNLLSLMMGYLAAHPEPREQIVAHPERRREMIDELTRRFGPVTDARILARDFELDGVTLLEGDMVARPTMLYGLDDRVHDCPMDVDLERENTEHMTFGHGIHSCPGVHLARFELDTTLTEWLGAIPEFRVASGATVAYESGIVGGVVNLPLEWDPGSTRSPDGGAA